MENTKYMNSYLAGLLLGLLLLATIYITGRGLGASGAVKSFTVATVQTIAPSHTARAKFYQEYAEEHGANPLKNWLVFEIVGAILGAFVSGLISDRLGFKLEKAPKTRSAVRVAAALTGGALFGFGAQLGRGCTSGAALSGMAVLSTGGLITMVAIFGGAYAFAYFVRKLWI
jgi:uncharacterized membrane protein YedE/YeeE